MGKLDNYFEHLNNHFYGGRLSTRSYEFERFQNEPKSADEFCHIKKFHESFLIIEVDLERATLKEAVTFKKFVNDLISSDYQNFIIDLHKVNFMDSTFLGVLVSILKSLRNPSKRIDGNLILILDYNNVSIFEAISRIKNLFNIYPNLQSAIDSL